MKTVWIQKKCNVVRHKDGDFYVKTGNKFDVYDDLSLYEMEPVPEEIVENFVYQFNLDKLTTGFGELISNKLEAVEFSKNIMLIAEQTDAKIKKVSKIALNKLIEGLSTVETIDYLDNLFGLC